MGLKPAALYAILLANPSKLITFRDFVRLLVAFGFEHERTVGSHRHYLHPDVPRSLPVQPAKGGKDAKRYQVRQFLDMVEENRLSLIE